MRLEWRLGDTHRARMHAEAIAAVRPEDTKVQRLILRALREEGRLDEAGALAGRWRRMEVVDPELLVELAELANDLGDMPAVRRWSSRALARASAHRRALALMHRAALKTLPLPQLRAEVDDWMARDRPHREIVTETALRIAFYEDRDWATVIRLCDHLENGAMEWQVHKVLALARGGHSDSAEAALGNLARSAPGEDEVDLVDAELACDRGDIPRQRAAINRVLVRHGLARLAEDRDGRLDVANLACIPAHPVQEGPLVTVVMTVFGEDPRLGPAIRSILEQSYRQTELILVDDCSPDGTPSILGGFARDDTRVRVLQTPFNGGTYLAKNLALTQARGELIAFMDSDDWSHPERIARQVATLRTQRRAVAIWHNALRIDSDGHIELRGRASRPAPISLMFHRRVHERLGFFDAVRVGADTELLARIQSVFGKDCLIHEPLPTTFMTRRAGSLTGSGTHGIGWRSLTGDRLAYDCAFRAWHRRMAAARREPFIPHPMTDRPFPAPEAILSASTPSATPT